MTWNVESANGIPPTPKNCHTANIVGNNMYLLGGYDGNDKKCSSIEFFILNIGIFKQKLLYIIN